MNAKISVFVIYVEVIIYLLLYNLHDCAFNLLDQSIFIWKVVPIVAFDELHFVVNITKITWDEVHTLDCIFSSSLKTII